MYQYSLYFVKPDYVNDFYYRVDVLYRFLKQCHDKILDEQLVSTVLDQPSFMHFIQAWAYYDQDHQYLAQLDQQKVVLHKGQEQIVVTGTNEAINVYTQSFSQLEYVLFPWLKQWNPRTFIVNYDTMECGWILPLTNRAFDITI
ncbi:sporulation inhibitor of replication protein SirA [Alkalibacillus sp. S2W]|uniref:sporulation inhibitor of replication protein SirA n=1 Tax=Alkalibacillus sp. S2W TaxID=3386553 RepID=UPI00398D68F3